MLSLLRGVWRSRYARRLALAFVATAIAATTLTALLVNLAISSRFDTYLQSQRQAREQQVVATLAADYLRTGGWQSDSLDQLAPAFVMSGTTIELLDPSGRRIWSTSRFAMNPEMSSMHREMMGIPQLAATSRLPIVVEGHQVGTAMLRVPRAVLPAADREFRDSVNRLLIGGAVAAGVLALLVGLALTRRTVARVAELTAAANELAAGQRDRRAAVSAHDEIGALATSFNAMADAVTREDELRRAFASDVAHELRTPLSILRSQLEAIQDGVTPPDPEVINSLHDESLRLGRLITDLETMADAGAAGFSLHRRELALRPLVRDVLAHLSGHIAEHEVDLVTDLADVTAWADAVRIRQVVTNLVSNAAKFTPPGGRITVTLQQGDGDVELAVADSGVGIPEDELPRVFDRFFRGTGSPAKGSGIGLAVAAELAAAHQGQISVESRLGQGSRFLVRLPGDRRNVR